MQICMKFQKMEPFCMKNCMQTACTISLPRFTGGKEALAKAAKTLLEI